MIELQPIDTAPKDGTQVLLYGTDGRDRPVFDLGKWMPWQDERWVVLVDTATEYSKVLKSETRYGWETQIDIWPTHWALIKMPEVAEAA